MAKNRRVHGGKLYKVRQLKQVRKGKAYWSLEWFGVCRHRGRRYFFPLGYDKDEALEKWKIIFLEIKSKQVPFETVLEMHKRGYSAGDTKSQKKRHISPGDYTIGDHLEFVWSHHSSLEMKEKTLLAYESCLIRIIGVGTARANGHKNPTAMLQKDQKEAIRRKPISILNRPLIRNYMAAMVDAAKKGNRSVTSARRSANSYCRQAKALFSREIREMSEDAGIELPDLTKFLEATSFKKTKVRYSLPNGKLIKETFENLGNPDKAPSKDVYVAIMLALFGGLRKSEVIEARKSWLTNAHTCVGIDVKITKNGLERFVPLPEEVFRWLKLYIPDYSNYMIEGTWDYRSDRVFDEAYRWLRSIGWKREKPFHELRKLFGSMIASSQGLEKARDYLDHEDFRTTQAHYAKTNMNPDLVALWENFKPIPFTSKENNHES